MTGEKFCCPHKEEDEGYLAAQAGLAISGNPYPRGTIRYADWARGWQTRTDEARHEKGEGYLAARAGQSLKQNPHPADTIRFAEWRDGWLIWQAETQRAKRLGRGA